ncbi:MAG TPA: OmpA family protein [Bryobacteraceae bacterium]|nr:OmpA family protein [Bryobacteraceae bacterium]
MKPAYFQKDNSGRDRWMVSYLDVLTILLILFVAIAAQALQAPAKPPEPVAQTAPPPPSPMASIQKELEQSQLDVHLDSRGIVISLPQALLFPPGDDRINADALETVGAIGEILRRIPNNVSLVGHSDAIPIHNRRFSSNWELASARGLRLLELLSSRYGVAESRLSVQSYGSFDPKSSDDTPDGRASNRRVEIVIFDAHPSNTP